MAVVFSKVWWMGSGWMGLVALAQALCGTKVRLMSRVPGEYL